jgi:hypothetical protein
MSLIMLWSLTSVTPYKMSKLEDKKFGERGLISNILIDVVVVWYWYWRNFCSGSRSIERTSSIGFGLNQAEKSGKEIT